METNDNTTRDRFVLHQNKGRMFYRVVDSHFQSSQRASAFFIQELVCSVVIR
jgi:hypothetical protein